MFLPSPVLSKKLGYNWKAQTELYPGLRDADLSVAVEE